MESKEYLEFIKRKLIENKMFKRKIITYETEELKRKEIKLFVGSSGNHFIPGSSLKGSFLIAYMYKKGIKLLCEKGYSRNEYRVRFSEGGWMKPKLDGFNNWISIDGLDKLIPPIMFRDIIVDDSNMGIFLLNRLTRKGLIPILAECIISGTKLTGEIFAVDNKVMKIIFESSREFYKKVVDRIIKELRWLKELKTKSNVSLWMGANRERLEDVISFLEKIRYEMDGLKDNEAITILGEGGSFYGKGLWIEEDTDFAIKFLNAPKKPRRPPFPRSILVVNDKGGLKIPGFVKISFDILNNNE